jgi:hypothetical protein
LHDLCRAALEGLFGVDANQLLVARKDAQLVNGWKRLGPVQQAFNTALLKSVTQGSAAVVHAYRCNEPCMPAQRGYVQRDVRCSAGSLFDQAGPNDRDRRLRGDTSGISKPVLVQHRVACHKRAQSGKIGNSERHGRYRIGPMIIMPGSLPLTKGRELPTTIDGKKKARPPIDLGRRTNGGLISAGASRLRRGTTTLAAF